MTADMAGAYLAFAHSLADAAARETLPRFQRDITIDDKGAQGDFDPVTAADRAAEDVIRERIKKTYPDHGIRGEERGQEHGASAYTWVVDPVDGTRAFICGIPLWTTLIALNDGKQPILGVIDQPYLGERYYASADGAFLKARGALRPLATRRSATLSDAIFSTTSPGLFHSARDRALHDTLVSATRLARYGCDAYAYALLAAGKIDLVVEPGLQAWDVQALLPIIRGAGGAVARFDGGDPQEGGDVIAAATPSLLAECLALVAKATG